MRGYLFAGSSIALVTCAQLAMKWGMIRLPELAGMAAILTHPAPYVGALAAVLAGIAAYGLSLGCWMAALNDLPLNRAYPLLSLSYGLVYILAGALPWFNEGYSLSRSLGVALIVLGVALINSRRKKVSNEV